MLNAANIVLRDSIAPQIWFLIFFLRLGWWFDKEIYQDCGRFMQGKGEGN